MEAKCCYCGSTNHEMAYRTVFEQGRVFSCINPVECLGRINARIKESIAFSQMVEDGNETGK